MNFNTPFCKVVSPIEFLTLQVQWLIPRCVPSSEMSSAVKPNFRQNKCFSKSPSLVSIGLSVCVLKLANFWRRAVDSSDASSDLSISSAVFCIPVNNWSVNLSHSSRVKTCFWKVFRIVFANSSLYIIFILVRRLLDFLGVERSLVVALSQSSCKGLL